MQSRLGIARRAAAVADVSENLSVVVAKGEIVAVHRTSSPLGS